MNNVRFKNFDYTTMEELPEGVVFFGTDGHGLFHQVTRNAERTPDDVPLSEAVADTIQQAKDLTDDDTSVGFEAPTYHVSGKGTPYARVSSMLTSAGGLSIAENVFFFDEEHYLVQIQCGSLLSTPASTLNVRKRLDAKLSEMVDIALSVTF